MTVTGFVLLGSLSAFAASNDELVSDAEATVQTFKQKDPKFDKFFSTASGYEASVGGQKFTFHPFTGSSAQR